MAEPIVPVSRSAQTSNTELVFLLRPRVVVFTSADLATPRRGTVSLPKTSFTQPEVQSEVQSEDQSTQSSASASLPPVASAAPAPKAPVSAQPDVEPLSRDTVPSSSIEIQPLSSAVSDVPSDVSHGDQMKPLGDPSVIVNNDILGK